MELIFKIICCSAVFIGFYHFILQREKMFRFNRFYLLATLILSFTIPFMELGIREFSAPQLEEFIPKIPQSQMTSQPVEIAIVPIPVSKTIIPQQTITAEPGFFQTLSWMEILGIIGLLISSTLLIRFFVNLWRINRLAIKSERVRKEGFTLVKIHQNVSPFSFFHYLFASKQDVENEKIQSEIFYHEFAHIKQKHSWDVVFVEFLMVFFWFNPFLYIYRKSIRTNHEFLADEQVLNHHFDTTAYQHLLLQKIPVKSQTTLSSSFNYLVTKKRLIMMTKQSSKIKTIALKFFSIPLLAVVMLVFSEKVSAQIEPGKGISKELFREYKKQVRKATVTVKDENGNKRKEIDPSKLDQKLMSEVYAQMSSEQKMKVMPIPSKKPTIITFDGANNLTLDLSKLNTAQMAKIGVDAGDLGLKIAGDVISGLDLKELENLNVEYFNSPEWEAQIAKIEKNAAEIEAYYNSPEWKKHIEGIEANAKRIEEYYNSPEWKEQIEKIEKNANEIEKYYNSPEWKNHIKEMEENAKKFNNPQAIKFRNEAFKFREKAFEFRGIAFKFRDKAFKFRGNAFKFRDDAFKLPKDSEERKRLMEKYDAEMEKYNLEMKNYDGEMEKYDAEMEKYDEKMSLYDQSVKSSKSA